MGRLWELSKTKINNEEEINNRTEGGLIMESNTSRDHIALEAMKCIIQTARRRRTIWNIIVTLFFPKWEKAEINYGDLEILIKSAYEIADAMIKERNRTKED